MAFYTLYSEDMLTGQTGTQMVIPRRPARGATNFTWVTINEHLQGIWYLRIPFLEYQPVARL